MPLFDMHCNECQAFHEDVIVRASRTPSCPDCGGSLTKDAKPHRTARTSFGYMAAGTTSGVQDGQVFHTKAERAAYEEKFKIDKVLDKKAGEGKVMHEEAQHEADLAAKAQGYKDHRSYRAENRKRNHMKRNLLNSVHKRIQVGG